MYLQKNNPDAPPLKFNAISKEDLLNIGLNSVAYLKPMGDQMIGIFSASGDLLHTVTSKETEDAKDKIRLENLICVNVH